MFVQKSVPCIVFLKQVHRIQLSLIPLITYMSMFNFFIRPRDLWLIDIYEVLFIPVSE